MICRKGKVYPKLILAFFVGWIDEHMRYPSDIPGYLVSSYFDVDGAYLGPDKHGVEPMFSDDYLEGEEE